MTKTPLNDLEKAAVKITSWIGSIWSVIVHTLLFAAAFISVFFGTPLEKVLLVLTTVVSLEAIYLSIFIQMSVNLQARSLASVEKEIDEIAEDVEEIAEDVEDIQKDVEEISDDVEEIQEDIDEIQEDVEEIQEDVEEIQEEAELVDQKIDLGKL